MFKQKEKTYSERLASNTGISANECMCGYLTVASRLAICPPTGSQLVAGWFLLVRTF